MKKNQIYILGFIAFFLFAQPVLARSGCCSHHGGVMSNGCGCNDGTSLSDTCAPYYSCSSGSNETMPIQITLPTVTPYIKPTSIPVKVFNRIATKAPTIIPTLALTLTPTITPSLTIAPRKEATARVVQSTKSKGILELILSLFGILD